MTDPKDDPIDIPVLFTLCLHCATKLWIGIGVDPKTANCPKCDNPIHGIKEKP